MGADKEVLPHSCKIEGVNKIKRPEEEELVVDWRRRVRQWRRRQEVVERRREHVHQVGLPSKDLDLLANYNITTNSLSTRLVVHPKISTCWPTTTSTPTASPLP